MEFYKKAKELMDMEAVEFFWRSVRCRNKKCNADSGS